MRQAATAVWFLIGCLSWCPPAWAAEGQAPAEGGPLPRLVLAAPKDAGQAAYLGLESKTEFTIGDIPAEVVIIQIFNMY
jgi:hypothetical protein